MAGTIKLRHQVALANNPAYDISANIWNDSLVVAGGSHGDLMQRDTGATDGWSLVTPAYEPTITTLAVNKGGTGIASYAVGDLLYASGATTLSKLADVAVGSVFVSGGVTTAPSWSANPAVTSLSLSSTLTIGASNPATTGAIRLANNSSLYARNAANTANIRMLSLLADDTMYVGAALLPDADVTYNLGAVGLRWAAFVAGTAYMDSHNLKDGITAPGTQAGWAQLYVDVADGDLKVKFGDGTVKTIVTDT